MSKDKLKRSATNVSQDSSFEDLEGKKSKEDKNLTLEDTQEQNLVQMEELGDTTYITFHI